MKKIFFGVIVLMFVLSVGVVNVFAAATHPTFGTFVNAGEVPADSKLVININYKVTNDEDSGNVGYWALSNYNKQVQVWQAGEESYYVIARYIGNWDTFDGALSPGEGRLQEGNASGTFQGGYTATFTAPECNPTFGNIETKDLGGTKADILLRTYAAGQTGPTTGYSFLNEYCHGYSNFVYNNWGWTYHYRNQTWNNFDYETSGDIVAR